MRPRAAATATAREPKPQRANAVAALSEELWSPLWQQCALDALDAPYVARLPADASYTRACMTHFRATERLFLERAQRMPAYAERVARIGIWAWGDGEEVARRTGPFLSGPVRARLRARAERCMRAPTADAFRARTRRARDGATRRRQPGHATRPLTGNEAEPA